MFFSGNDDVWNIIFVAVLIWCSYSTVRLIMKVSKGLMLQRNAKYSNEVVIRGTSVIYKTTNYIFAIVYEVFIIGIFLSFLIRYTFDFFLFFFLCIDIFLLCIQVIIHFVGIFKEKYVYLCNISYSFIGTLYTEFSLKSSLRQLSFPFATITKDSKKQCIIFC